MRAVIYFATAVILSTAEASANCSAPSAPSCVLMHGAFDDEWAFTRCKREMQDYRSAVEDFVQCNHEQIQRSQQASDEAASDYDDAIDSFNRRTLR